MALTRARVVAGPGEFRTRVAQEITAVLRAPPGLSLAPDITAMRALVEREKPARGAWDFKLTPGGLLDVEFVAQFVVLRFCSEHPEVLVPETQLILREAGRLHLLPTEQAVRLVSAHRLYTNTLQIMRLALEEEQSPDTAGDGVKRRLANASGLSDFASLEEEVSTARQAVREIFRTVLSTV